MNNLEAEIIKSISDAPGELVNYLALGDYLMDKNDPFGEIINGVLLQDMEIPYFKKITKIDVSGNIAAVIERSLGKRWPYNTSNEAHICNTFDGENWYFCTFDYDRPNKTIRYNEHHPGWFQRNSSIMVSSILETHHYKLTLHNIAKKYDYIKGLYTVKNNEARLVAAALWAKNHKFMGEES